MLPVMFEWVGCKHYERKPINLVLWLKYKYCGTGVNMTLNIFPYLLQYKTYSTKNITGVLVDEAESKSSSITVSNA